MGKASIALAWLLIARLAAADDAPSPVALDPVGAGIGRVVDDLGYTAIDGTSGTLGALADGKPLVIACFAVDCPVSRKEMPRLVELQHAYAGRAAFLWLGCGQDEDDAARAAVARAGATPPVANDRALTLAKALGVRSTTEMLVLDGARTLRFRGALDDAHGLTYDGEARHAYLVDALDAVLAGERVRVPATAAPGCAVAAGRAAAEPLTWARHVAPILYARCVECHRPDGVGPFALLAYADAKRKAATIARVVQSRAMPPWFAEHGVGPPFANERRLSDDEIATLVAWAASGCAQGDAAAAPAAPPARGEWEMGEPDAVVQVEQPQDVPAQGVLPYRYVRVRTSFAEDRWVSAVELRPTAPSVVHHAQAFLMQGDRHVDDIQVRDGGRLRSYFAAMVPGMCSQTYPPGYARKLPKGATVEFEIHYVPDGTARQDRMRLGLRFATAPPRHEIHSFDIRSERLDIPPGDAAHVEVARYVLPGAARVLTLQPHMHLRGKSFTIDVAEPGREPRRLLSVPQWDFRWQLSYHLAAPLDLAAGTVVTVTGTYDNSAGNPANPDPTQRVRFGANTTDEMLIAFGEWCPLP